MDRKFVASEEEIQEFVKMMGEDPFNENKLEVIFNLQKKFDKKLADSRNLEMSVSEWIMYMTAALEDEISEIRGEINWKHWKNNWLTDEGINFEALKMEVIDVVHFVLAIARISGLTSEDIYEYYVTKNIENHRRQEGLSKDGLRKDYIIADGTTAPAPVKEYKMKESHGERAITPVSINGVNVYVDEDMLKEMLKDIQEGENQQ